MSDILYQKQSQLERLAAERSAQHLAWEQQLALVRDDAEKVKRCAYPSTINANPERYSIHCLIETLCKGVSALRRTSPEELD